jgi:hypothetical protein
VEEPLFRRERTFELKASLFSHISLFAIILGSEGAIVLASGTPYQPQILPLN